MLVFGILIASALVIWVDAGSWSVAVSAVKRVQRNNTLRLSDVYGQALTNNNDLWYKGTVYVGTPPIPFTVLFDTGSSYFWLPKKGCKATGPKVRYCPNNLELYDPDDSATSQSTKVPFKLEYGTGSAKGFFYKDYLTFGGSLRFKKPIIFGAAEVIEHRDQGIMGLGSSVKLKDAGISVMHEAWRQKILDAPIFTIHMRDCSHFVDDECHDAGMITFGGLDNHNCEKVEGYVNVDPKSSRWEFTMAQFQIGRSRVATNIKAISDSGTNRITAPTETVNEIMKEIGAIPIKGGHVVKCDFDATVTLKINGHQYTIPSHRMLMNLHNNWCLVLLDSFDFNNQWILGTPFTKTLCQIHNIEKRTIGFAKARN
ncbi:Eukaryotic aspartyl protease [Aphelenchoides besseyi]|nr:Eukaryotic aspartyl protease [Aphelenchoides besseyi]